jgi:hypothetical protein
VRIAIRTFTAVNLPGDRAASSARHATRWMDSNHQSSM